MNGLEKILIAICVILSIILIVYSLDFLKINNTIIVISRLGITLILLYMVIKNGIEKWKESN